VTSAIQGLFFVVVDNLFKIAFQDCNFIIGFTDFSLIPVIQENPIEVYCIINVNKMGVFWIPLDTPNINTDKIPRPMKPKKIIGIINRAVEILAQRVVRLGSIEDCGLDV